jgi:autotransporter-associated beta strand protein
MTGGQFNVAGTVASVLSVGTNRGLGHMNITGTAEVNLAAAVDFRLCSNQTGTLGYFGEVNLAGGTLSTRRVTSPDIGGDVYGGVFNFNGGVLKAIQDETTFMQNLKAVSNPTPGAAYVYPGGAVIDTNTFNITIAQPLLEPVGQGVTSISFTPGTQTYVAPPRASIASPPAGGPPATAQAFATLDAAGQINGIVLTKPGFGYASAPAVTFDFGDATATATIGDISGGGLTKNGAGELTLSGICTYTGDTVVNAGTLTLADNAGLKFVIGANGVNNKIRGAGTVNLYGDFTIDLSGAAAVVGNSWTLVDFASLALVNYEISPGTFPFTVVGWTENPVDPGVWTLPDGDNVWTFTRQTGVLTYTSNATPYDLWIANYPSLTGDDKLPGADPDNDGMINQQEFAYGLDPTTGASVNPITVPLDKSTRQFTYTRWAASGLSYTVWTSTDLQTWTQDTTAVQTPGAPVAGVESVVVTLTDPAPMPDRIFVRVKAQ